MTWLTDGPVVVKHVTTIPVSNEMFAEWDLTNRILERSMRRATMDDLGRFLMDITEGSSHLWGDNTDRNPAIVVEQPDRVLWDKTREDVGWWWLGEPEHDCDY